MANEPLQFELHGETWTLRFARLRGRCLGYCHPDKRDILIHDHTTERKRLELILHEVLHGADWSKDEAWVSRTAADIAALLFADGWNRNAQQKG